MHTTMKRRMLAVPVAALAAATLALTGCGSTDGGSGSGDGGTTTVTWWSWNPDQATAKPYIEAFEKEHPDIKIEHRFIQYSDYASTVQLGVQSGSGPDVFGTQVGALTTQFAPLAEDLAPVFEEELGGDWADLITASEQLTVDGKLVGAPWMITGGGIVWANQTIIDELGLTMPTNRDELVDFCAAVQASGRDCITQGAKDAWQNIDVFQVIANQIEPGAFYEAIDGETPFDSDTFVESFAQWKSLFDDGIFQDGALGMTAYPDASDSFRKGEAVLMINGTWENSNTTNARMKDFTEIYGEASGASIYMPYQVPALVDGADTDFLFGGPDVGFAVSASSKVKDAANTFVMWLTASEAGQNIMADRVQQPSLRSVSLNMDDVITDEQRAALESQAPLLADLIGARQIQSADVQTSLGDALSAVASGQMTPEEAAASVQKAIDAAG